MTTGHVDCIFLQHPKDEQIRQIVELYRAQGWWQANDDAKEDLVAKLIAGSQCFVLAMEDETVVGMGRAISDGISDAYIQDVTVRLDRRKQGIGKMILRALVDRLHEDGIFWIGLISEPGSAGLYKGAGFQEMAGSIPMVMLKQR